MFSTLCLSAGKIEQLDPAAGHLINRKSGKLMRKLLSLVVAMLMLATVAFAVPKLSNGKQTEPPFPAILRNARYVYVAAYDGDQFNPNLWQEDRAAISAVQDSIRKWGKLGLVYRPQEADIIILVQSRPSEDILAVYDAHSPNGQYLWRLMGRDGLQTGETPFVTQFQKGFEAVQPKAGL